MNRRASKTINRFCFYTGARPAVVKRWYIALPHYYRSFACAHLVWATMQARAKKDVAAAKQAGKSQYRHADTPTPARQKVKRQGFMALLWAWFLSLFGRA